ncbi:MAG: hypothetical protein GY786_12520 [Proteobacteria bacterium]|nr:hypothetical protein [Pseudomonadota bacterium]
MKKTLKEATQSHFEDFELRQEQFEALNKMQSDAWREEKKNRPRLKWYQRSQLFFSIAGAAVLLLVVGMQWGNLPEVGVSPETSLKTAYNRSLMNSELTIREQINKQLNQQHVKLDEAERDSSLSRKVAYGNQGQTHNPITTLRRQIASQIAYNHSKNLALEIRTTNLKRINKFYKKLDFTLVNPQLLQDSNWQLLGGRYCSIQQRLAAQMKLFNRKSQQIYSLYQYQLRSDSILRDFPDPWQVRIDGLLVTLWVEQGALHGLAGIQ